MVKNKPSKYHNNRGPQNWLIYDINDQFLIKYSEYYKGVLYDLGCGERALEPFYLQYADKYVGVDWNDSLHELKADLIMDLNKPMNLEDEIADTLVSLSVMEHLYEPQVFLNECNRILKTGGYFVLQVPWQWWIHEAPHDYYRYTPYGLRHILKKAGFEDIKVEPGCGFFTTWIIKFNYFTSRSIRGPEPLKWLIKSFLVPFWGIGQILAPYLDKLDRNWEVEAQGFFVVARKE